MRTLKPWIWIAGGLLCAAIAGAGLLGGGPSLLGYSGAELYGHAWVQWWHGESLPGWPAGTELAVGADPWPVIDPLPTLLGALGGRLVGYTWSWNLLGLLAVAGAFWGGASLARRWDGDPWVGGLVAALGPALAGSLASGLTEDWSLGLLAVALGLLSAASLPAVLVGGVLLGLTAWCGLYLAFIGAGMALVLGIWRIAKDPSAWKGQLGAAALALCIALPAAMLQGERLSGEGHRQGQVTRQVEPSWRLNPWQGADLASFITPGPADLSERPLIRLHPAYLGWIVLLLAVYGGRSRWWLLLAVPLSLSTGRALFFAGNDLGLDNPLVLLEQRLPIASLLNHHARLLLGAQLALAVLAARGAARLPQRWRYLAAAAVALELTLASPMPWPLPVTGVPVESALVELGEDPPPGRLLVLPVSGPGVHFQRPLFEQRLHGMPLAHTPNRPGADHAVTANPTGRWLAGPPHVPMPAGADPEALRRAGIGAVFVRKDAVDRVVPLLGEPAHVSAGGAVFRIE
ncbi:MAG: hypothetical protein VX899_22520 [Myxococcota bacterium]|nr:hypothetical protein [Myxococcota bacterium]